MDRTTVQSAIDSITASEAEAVQAGKDIVTTALADATPAEVNGMLRAIRDGRYARAGFMGAVFTFPGADGSTFVSEVEGDIGDGLRDDAIRHGWQAEIGPTPEQVEAAQLEVLKTKNNTPERVAAVAALKELQASKTANPVGPEQHILLMTLNFFRGLLLDESQVNKAMETARETALATAVTALDRKLTVTTTPAP